MKSNHFPPFSPFPVFQKLKLSDKQAYQDFYAHFEPYSDFSFNNLLVWFNMYDDLEISHLNGNVVLRFRDPFAHQAVTYTLFGKTDCQAAITAIFDYLHMHQLPLKLHMVPEVVLQNLPRSAFRIRENRANRDYIFDVARTHALQGKDYSDLRHKLNYFQKKYGSITTIGAIDLKTLANRQLLARKLQLWEAGRPSANNDRLRLETVAIERLLDMVEVLEVQCIGMYMEGELQSFSLLHLPPQPGFAIGNHIKYNYAYRYIFDASYFHTIRALHEQGITFINGEQDLGIAGLRTHKQEMHPANYLKRYDITPVD